MYKNKMKCIKPEDYIVWGDYNSVKAQQINVVFRLCEGHAYCESKEEILKWLSGKFVVLVYN